MNSSAIEHFDALTAQGLRVIPLRENSKIPLCSRWNSDWRPAFLRDKLCQRPESNIGLLLGEIVDVEGDSYEANKKVADLIGDYPHPQYQSSKSVHHLFRTPDPTLRIMKHGKIEFRGEGHQSVLPPSQCRGIQYQWIDDCDFQIPEMPEALRNFFFALRHRNDPPRYEPGRCKVWCASCQQQRIPHKSRWETELGVFRLLGREWMCQSCRGIDLRPLCRKFERKKFGPEEAQKILQKQAELGLS